MKKTKTEQTVPCPHCGKGLTRAQVASMLGKLGRGKRKQVSAAERKRRADRLRVAREKRWA